MVIPGGVARDFFANVLRRHLAPEEGVAAAFAGHRLRHRLGFGGGAFRQHLADAVREVIGVADEAAGHHQRVAADAHGQHGAVAIDDVAARAGDHFAVCLLMDRAGHQVVVVNHLQIDEAGFDADDPAEVVGERTETLAEHGRPVNHGQALAATGVERLRDDPRVVQVSHVYRIASGRSSGARHRILHSICCVVSRARSLAFASYLVATIDDDGGWVTVARSRISVLA